MGVVCCCSFDNERIWSLCWITTHRSYPLLFSQLKFHRLFNCGGIWLTSSLFDCFPVASFCGDCCLLLSCLDSFYLACCLALNVCGCSIFVYLNSALSLHIFRGGSNHVWIIKIEAVLIFVFCQLPLSLLGNILIVRLTLSHFYCYMDGGGDSYWSPPLSSMHWPTTFLQSKSNVHNT